MVAWRLASLPLILLGVAVLTFGLLWVSPYDQAAAYATAVAGQDGVSAEAREAYAQAWGLDRSAPEQFAAWLSNLVRGDLGISTEVPGVPVAQVIMDRLPATMALLGTASAIVLVVSIILGVLAVRFKGTPIDTGIRLLSYTGTFAPSFWLGVLALYVFSMWLGWLPAGGPGDVRSGGGIEFTHLILPATTLAVSQLGWFTLFVRDTLADRMRDDHVRFAEAQGDSRTGALVRQALPNALLPYVTLAGAHLPELIGGAILIESIFSWPGLGNLTRRAAVSVDIPLLLALVLGGAILTVVGNLLADIGYRVLDPRTRRGSP